MTKIGILTWHKTVNHGAVLQAYASQKILEGLGCEPVLLDYQRAVGSMDDILPRKLKRWGSKLTPSKLKTVFANKDFGVEKAAMFEVFRRDCLLLGDRYDHEPELNAVMIGSDMVFDFYEGYNPFMYGKNVSAPYVFSYAACFGYATRILLDSFDHKSEIETLLQRMDYIGYRDENTRDLVSYLAPAVPIEKNIDPVLLYAFSEERKKWRSYGWAKEKPYILIYSYTYNLDSKEEIAYVRRLARELGCKIVSVGYCHLWCDEIINADPKEFVELFENARLVITDTFHGTVFSLAFAKDVRVIIRRNAFKVLDLLSDLRIVDQVVVNPKHLCTDEFSDSEVYDHAAVQEQIAVLRERSMNYLRLRIAEAKSCKA